MKSFLINVTYYSNLHQTTKVRIKARTQNSAVKKYLKLCKINLEERVEINIIHEGKYTGKPLKFFAGNGEPLPRDAKVTFYPLDTPNP